MKSGKVPDHPEIGLTKEEILRFSRHLLIPEVGMAGQKALRGASVLIVGAGGLGSPSAMYLAAAGVGRIGIVDFDVVDLTNLQRQLLHSTADVGRPKVESARETLNAINPHTMVEMFETQLRSDNAFEILSTFDVIVDGTDNFPTRYLVNDACVLLGKPNVYGSVFRFDGQVSVFYPTAEGPCYRCLYPAPPPPGLVPSCAEGGVLGVLPGIIGCLQALETIKLITGQGETLVGKLLLFDALNMTFREVTLKKDSACPICGSNPSIHQLVDYEDFCGITSRTDLHSGGQNEITVEELKSRLDRGEKIFLLDVREPQESALCTLGGRLIPRNELPNRVSELDSSNDIVVYCKTGNRSAQAIELLKHMGFKKLWNLIGGIDAWAQRIDPTMPRY